MKVELTKFTNQQNVGVREQRKLKIALNLPVWCLSVGEVLSKDEGLF